MSTETLPSEHSAPPPITDRQVKWVETMEGVTKTSGLVVAHDDSPLQRLNLARVGRKAREEAEDLLMSQAATRASGAGNRLEEEDPDDYRTCFERDRDRILHASAFRRLAGKTQVFVFPADHQRTRLTHALEVAQVATAMSRALALNVALTEAIALGHDCGHGPGGHASEDAFAPFISGGYHHAVWGADVALRPLNLCAETLDGIRNHSWSRPAPTTPEGEVVSWADRFAYCTADLDDAMRAHIVHEADIPRSVTEILGSSHSARLATLIEALITCATETGVIGLDEATAGALAELRSFNYERVYNRPESIDQATAVISVLQALVETLIEDPSPVPGLSEAGDDITRAVVSYVAGMTDRFAFTTATALLGWPADRLPVGIDVPHPSS